MPLETEASRGTLGGEGEGGGYIEDKHTVILLLLYKDYINYRDEVEMPILIGVEPAEADCFFRSAQVSLNNK